MATRQFGNSKLIEAIRGNDPAGVSAALAAGADVDEVDVHGFPGLPLRTACFAGNLAIIRDLLSRGADVNAPTAEGIGAPLRLALRAKHRDVVNLLLAEGAIVPPDVVLMPELFAAATKAVTNQPPPAASSRSPASGDTLDAPHLVLPRQAALPGKADNVPAFVRDLPETIIEQVEVKGGCYGVDTNVLSMDFERMVENEAKARSASTAEDASSSPQKQSFWKIGR